MLEHWKTYHHAPHELKALDLLEEPSKFPGMRKLSRYDILVQLFTLHSFQPYRSWSVFRTASDPDSFLVRRVRWDRSRDYMMRDLIMEGDEPTVYGSDVVMQAQEIEERLKKLSGVHLSPFAMKSTIGTDGVTFGVKRRVFGQSVELSWWCEPPPGWEELAEWYHEFEDHLESRLPAHTDRFGKNTIRP